MTNSKACDGFIEFVIYRVLRGKSDQILKVLSIDFE